MSVDTLQWLEDWLTGQCGDDEWREEFGVTIESLSNPGWSVKIDLTGTTLENLEVPVLVERKTSEQDWMFCKIEDARFMGAGGTKNLIDILEVFRGLVNRKSSSADRVT